MGELAMGDAQFQTDTGRSESEVAVQDPPVKEDGRRKRVPAKTPPKHLPSYKVLLHNDDVNDFDHVILTICRITTLSQQEALLRAMEAHEAGVSLLLVTHKERAELYQEQFTSAKLTVTIEPDQAA
jgi:ATP-dependent Clp protease adaptor protein ClpS